MTPIASLNVPHFKQELLAILESALGEKFLFPGEPVTNNSVISSKLAGPRRACYLLLFLCSLVTSCPVSGDEPVGESRRLKGIVACFSPDGRQILTGGTDKVLRLWDTAHGEEIRQLGEPTDPILCICFSPALGDAP